MNIWLYGYMGIWMYGYMNIWMSSGLSVHAVSNRTDTIGKSFEGVMQSNPAQIVRNKMPPEARGETIDWRTCQYPINSDFGMALVWTI